MKLQILIADSGEHAARNLNSLLSVLEVSRLLGFSTPDYFTRVFKKHTGSVTSAVRK